MGKKLWHILMRLQLIVAVITGLVVMCPLNASAADRGPLPAFDQSDTIPELHNEAVDQHVEGHIAFLRAELKITPAQDQLWASVGDAMREDIKEMQSAERQVSLQSHGRETAVQYLQNRVMFANLRARGEARFLAAIQPLYDNLSAQQKRIADELLVSTGTAE